MVKVAVVLLSGIRVVREARTFYSLSGNSSGQGGVEVTRKCLARLEVTTYGHVLGVSLWLLTKWRFRGIVSISFVLLESLELSVYVRKLLGGAIGGVSEAQIIHLADSVRAEDLLTTVHSALQDVRA